MYFAIFHVSGNSVFSHVTAMVLNMPFNKDDRILIRISYYIMKMPKEFQVRVGMSEVFRGC